MQAMQLNNGQLSNPNQVVTGQGQTGQTQMGQTGQSQMGQSQMGQDQSGFSNSQNQTNPQSAMGQQSGTNQGLGSQQQKNTLTGTAGQGMNERRATRTPRKKVQLEKPVRPVLSKDSLQTILSGKLYNYANLFFSEMELPDSASYYYDKILTDFPKKSVVPGTYYALGIYYQSLNQKEKADSLFKIVINNYKNSEFAQLSAKKMKTVEDIPVTDPADSFYVAAEKKYYDKKYNEAITDFRSLMEKFPKSKRAPKAAYYIAFIYENDLKDVDSTTAAYELIAKKFPTSDVFTKTQKRIDVYQAEKAKKEKAAEEAKKPAQPVTTPPSAAKPALNEAAVSPDSIKLMMQKALQKDALKEKQRRAADSLRIVQEKQKRTTDSLNAIIEKQK
jgi:TolA-binding protein